MRRASWALLCVLALAGCNERASGTPPKAPPPPVPVVSGQAVQKSVPLDIGAIGAVQAYTTVGVKSQVAGQVVQVHFGEGQVVRRNDLLFTIDPRPFENALRQAEANVARDTASLRQAEAAVGQREAEVQQTLANLERDQAQLNNARVNEARYRELLRKELIAREQYDQVRTTMSALEATVLADRAAVDNARAAAAAGRAGMENARAAIKAGEALVENARLQLSYTTIRAPMEGRTGNLLVQAGNVVKANEDNPLVVIAQTHPVYVSFAVPEQHLAEIKRRQAAGPLPVRAAAPGSAPVTGRLTFINNVVDPNTGTIQLKATFTNDKDALWPGQYVDVVLTLASETAIVVPSEAIQAGQQGPFVFVIKPDRSVEARPVEPGRRAGSDTVVLKGLAGGERVVTDGQLRLVPGAKVEVR